MDDLRARLERALGDQYALGDELGGGGMARVFAATETALDRKVAIKVLSPALAAGVSHQRFAREIRVVASLQQANIVPVLSTGEIPGAPDDTALPYYTMPFVEGRSLHDRLAREGALPVSEAVSILRDVARALTYAHERGIVHRDIKPGNVLLSGEAAVVTDFGVARALSAARLHEHDSAHPESTLTEAGVSVGTPAYMAPEQVIADPNVDHRVDLYAFGCLAYELFTGAPPFAGRPLAQVLSAQVTETPAPLGTRCPTCPPVIVRTVMQCLEKNPANRPVSARDLLRALDVDTGPISALSQLRNRFSNRRRNMIVGVSVTAVIVVATGWYALSGGDAVSSIAVVPFLNLDNSAQEYLADGIADQLATALGNVNGIRIVGRTAGRQFKGRQDVDARTIGKALGARHVLQGSVRQVGTTLHVTATLSSARDNSEVWSENYDRTVTDVVAVQDAIARDITRKLRPSNPFASGVASGTSNGDAYDLYIRGRFLLQRRSGGVRQAAANFADAVAKDRNYARAYASFALALELLPYFEDVNVDSLGAIAIPAAQRALVLDTTLAEAHTALAMAYQHRYQWQRAEDAYRRAIAVGPDEWDAQIQYARFLFYTGRVAEALPRFQRARELDPNSAVASAWVGHLLDLSGQREAALAELTRALQIDSTNPPSLWMMALAQLRASRPDRARVYAERLRRVWPAWTDAAMGLLAELGDSGAVRAWLREAVRRPNSYRLVFIYANLRDSTRLFAALEEATAHHDIWPTQGSLSEPYLDFVRRSARFAAIVRSVGLDERVFTSPTGGRPR